MTPFLLFLAFTTHFPSPAPTTMIVRSNVVYAAANKTLYRSDDGGATFAPRAADIGYGVAVDPADPDIVYTYQQASVRRSMDGGATWTSIKSGLPSILQPTKLVISAQHPSTLYLANTCASRLFAEGGLFRSDNRGDSWSGKDGNQCVTDAALDPLADKVYPLIRDTYYFAYQPHLVPTHQVVADARNPQLRYGIGYDSPNNYAIDKLVLLVSFDAGATWQHLGLTGIDGSPAINELALDGDSGRLFMATSNGVYVSPQGGPYWVRIAAAPRANTTNVAIGGSFLYVNTTRGMYRAPLATLAPFTALGALPGVPAPVRALAADPNSGVLYAAGNGVWRSPDAGQHWEWNGGDDVPRAVIAVDGAGEVYAFDFTGELFASPHRHGVLFVIRDRALLKSVDGGRTWQQINTDVHALAFDPNRPDVLYAGTARGLFRSLDAGATWMLVGAAETTAIAVAPSRSSTLYRTANRLQRSDDDGATWRDLTAPAAIDRIAVDPLNESSVWIVGEGKLWHSSDGGIRWSDATGNLPSAVEEIVLDRDGRHIHVLAGGVWDAVVRVERRRATSLR